MMPQQVNVPKKANQFSVTKATEHVRNMAEKPHFVGAPAHKEVINYLEKALQNLGLESQLQEGYSAGDWGNLSKATNIISRIKGQDSGKALLLLSHYDSNPHSSLGASDAASGVATILEGIRAYLTENIIPKNDIIILFTDAEELGLNGAQLFVNNHPWAKNVGLVLNFEARGSGGPSYMLVETNQGNAKLIKAFNEASPPFPVANSMMYSIYKMLPNDTDLTVFREEGHINGFNFAFIDDHFDYHTKMDTPNRMDPNTLAHQGTYFMSLVNYFSNVDLSHLDSNEDYIYFNIPFFKLVTYPFSWIIPMLLLSTLLFTVLLIYGIRKKKLQWTSIGKGFIVFLSMLLIGGLLGYYGWKILLYIYPQYNDILHGFTYNGYEYIISFFLLTTALCFYGYHKTKTISTTNLMIAPLFVWLIIASLMAWKLPGAAFFIIPVIAALVILYIKLIDKKPNYIWAVLLSIPLISLFTPMVQMFPVGLGLKMLVASCIFVVLIFGLLIPVFGEYKRKKELSGLLLIIATAFIIKAHSMANFTIDRPWPSSLVYLLNADTQKAYWLTYNTILDPWNEQYITDKKTSVDSAIGTTLSSKYKTGFSYITKAPIKEIKSPLKSTQKDTIIGNKKYLSIAIEPQRNVNRLEVYTNNITIHDATVNSVPLSKDFLNDPNRKSRLVTHYISTNEPTLLELVIPSNEKLEITLMEASNNLLNHELFSIPKRPKNSIPMPFVLNDAIIITKTVQF